jgi:phosphatidylethanolamine/phosphatidyl-N-methylethanolamine N-methyltransferase
MARRWRATGAVLPSSGRLARAMVEAVGGVTPGRVVVELGPGTGVFSRELLGRLPGVRVVAVEVNEAFADRLEAAVPGITVVRGCASEVDAHLARLGLTRDDVAAVVSGLPLLSLPGDLPRRILASVAGVLRPGQKYVQFTYSVRAWERFDLAGFDRRPPKKVWLNVPPANVLTFVRTG